MRRALGPAAAVLLALTGCHPVPEVPTIPTCAPTPAAEVVPADGVYLGTNLEWGRESLADYAGRLGRRPAVAVSFADFPLSAAEARDVDGAVEQLRVGSGLLLLTLEPHGGLATVTDDAVRDLARRLDGWNRLGVPVVVRFAHEMNGSWYAWGQQPEAYVAAFRRLAGALHRDAPGSATMWAPNYGGGYPYPSGAHHAALDDAALDDAALDDAALDDAALDDAALDTDGDGALTSADDPYAPYWPGDDAVDWVGMSLYHWGSAYPWGENEVPEADKFVAQLTGEYVGAAGDERRVPDFHAVYGVGHGKPVAVPETAALHAPGRPGPDELTVKRAWWRQVYDPALTGRLPRLAMVNWFEWDKVETEVGGRVAWAATRAPAVREAYRADLPDWALWGEAVPACP